MMWVSKVLPLSHGLALMRYGLLGDRTGLHNIWGGSDASGMAALSLLVVAAFALLLITASVRIFSRSVVK